MEEFRNLSEAEKRNGNEGCNIIQTCKGIMMQKIKYQTSILENGLILLPKDIMDRYFLKSDQKINVTIEVSNRRVTPRKEYSFCKARKLLRGVKGNMSEDIISGRESIDRFIVSDTTLGDIAENQEMNVHLAG